MTPKRHRDTVSEEQKDKRFADKLLLSIQIQLQTHGKIIFCKPMDKLFLFENKNSLKSQMTDRVPLWRGNTHHAPCCHGKVQNLLTIYCPISQRNCPISQIRETCSSPAPGGKLHFSPTSAMTDDSCPDDL